MSFDTIPSKASIKPKPFQAHVSDQELQEFKQLLKLSKIGPKTYENLTADPSDYTGFGISREWLVGAKQHWESSYDWRKTEARINSLPNFTAQIEDSGFTFDVHFAALFSQKADAVPLVLVHGWPGSFLEFLTSLELLKRKYTPDTLPFHVVVPSLPGYAYSSGPPLDQDYNTEGMARVVDKLMLGLGFGDGYISQGGDIGSFVTRILGATAPSCKAIHLHMCIGVADSSLDGVEEIEMKGLKRAQDFSTLGNAYAREHGTRPATVGLVLSSSPLAQLAWIGEKFLQWSDKDPPLDEILDSVSLYWFTESFARGIFPYRQFFGANPQFFHPDPEFYVSKPMGFSYHVEELAPTPRVWIEKTGKLVWFRRHEVGGHFAAMEQAELFVKDMEDFVGEVWAGAK